MQLQRVFLLPSGVWAAVWSLRTLSDIRRDRLSWLWPASRADCATVTASRRWTTSPLTTRPSSQNLRSAIELFIISDALTESDKPLSQKVTANRIFNLKTQWLVRARLQGFQKGAIFPTRGSSGPHSDGPRALHALHILLLRHCENGITHTPNIMHWRQCIILGVWDSAFEVDKGSATYPDICKCRLLWLLNFQNTAGSLRVNFRHSRFSLECCKL